MKLNNTLSKNISKFGCSQMDTARENGILGWPMTIFHDIFTPLCQKYLSSIHLLCSKWFPAHQACNYLSEMGWTILVSQLVQELDHASGMKMTENGVFHCNHLKGCPDNLLTVILFPDTLLPVNDWPDSLLPSQFIDMTVYCLVNLLTWHFISWSIYWHDSLLTVQLLNCIVFRFQHSSGLLLNLDT